MLNNLKAAGITQKYLDELTYKIIGCAIEVHRIMGPGLLESVYKRCFLHELKLRGLSWKCEQIIHLIYKDIYVDTDFRYDVLVEDLIVVELKSIESFAKVHEAIILSYMQSLKKPKGLLLNFNCANIVKEGQKTFVNNIYAGLPKQ
jgi:GxxExxY protein